jgi:hypothetical protein
MNKYHKDTMIFQFALMNDEIEDWLAFTDGLIEKWESMTFDSSKLSDDNYLYSFFKNSFEFRLATLLMMDGLLPESARIAYGTSIVEAQYDLKNKKIVCPNIFVNGDKRGRKSSHRNKIKRIKDVRFKIEQGVSLKQTYQEVANKYHKSTDTIRRDYERWYKDHGDNYKKMMGK